MIRKPMNRYGSADIRQMMRENPEYAHYIDCDRYPKQDLGNSPFARVTGEDRGRKFVWGFFVSWCVFCALVGLLGMIYHLVSWVMG